MAWCPAAATQATTATRPVVGSRPQLAVEEPRSVSSVREIANRPPRGSTPERLRPPAPAADRPSNTNGRSISAGANRNGGGNATPPGAWKPAQRPHTPDESGRPRSATVAHQPSAEQAKKRKDLSAELRSLAREGDIAVLRRHLDAGADPAEADETGRNALHIAAAVGRSAAVRHLLDAKAPVDCPGGDFSATALHYAAQIGETYTMRALLAAGASTDSLDLNGKTPLHRAAESGHLAAIDCLLAAGSRVDIVEATQQHTALMAAAAEGHEGAVRALLAAGSALPPVGFVGKTMNIQGLMRVSTLEMQRQRALDREAEVAALKAPSEAAAAAAVAAAAALAQQSRMRSEALQQQLDHAAKAAQLQRVLTGERQQQLDEARANTEAAVARAVEAARGDWQRQLDEERAAHRRQLQYVGSHYCHSALTSAPVAHRIASMAMMRPHLLRDNDPIVRDAVDHALRLLEVDIRDEAIASLPLLGTGGQAVVHIGPRSLIPRDAKLYPADDDPLDGIRGADLQVVTSRSQLPKSAQIVIKHFRAATDSSNALREALILSLLRHRNILPLEGVLLRRPAAGDADQQLGIRGLVLPYMAGGTLQRAILDRKLPLLSQKLAAIGDAVSAVAYLHSLQPRAIVHCDIKPENLLLEDDGRVVLCDFGVWYEGAIGGATKTPANGDFAEIGGTVQYMAPEALGLRDAAPMGRRADIFSCGMVLWQLLSGAGMPWIATSTVNVIAKLTMGERPPLAVAPAALQPVLAAMWHQDANQRPYAPQLLSMLAAAARESAKAEGVGADAARLVEVALRLEAEAHLYDTRS